MNKFLKIATAAATFGAVALYSVTAKSKTSEKSYAFGKDAVTETVVTPDFIGGATTDTEAEYMIWLASYASGNNFISSRFEPSLLPDALENVKEGLEDKKTYDAKFKEEKSDYISINHRGYTYDQIKDIFDRYRGTVSTRNVKYYIAGIADGYEAGYLLVYEAKTNKVFLYYNNAGWQ